ncbi:MAG: hypothetical protein KKF56_05455 [Nanoarchaeota archaeon]|nr:hypothetical protein [Nanoarchaeota archaeon]
MAEKKKRRLAIILPIIIILLLGIGIYFFVTFEPTAKTEVTDISEDGSAGLFATFYDEDGNAISVSGGLAQSFFGQNAPQVSYITFLIKVKYVAPTGGETPVDINNLILYQPSVGLSENVVKDSYLISSIATTQTTFVDLINTKGSCTSDAQCDTTEKCKDTNSDTILDSCLIDLDNYESANLGVANNVDFKTKIKGEILGAFGVPSDIISDEVLLTYDIRGDFCSDGTAYKSCSFTNPLTPKLCQEQNLLGVVDLYNNAEVCGCPVDYSVSGSGFGSTCIIDTCTDADSTSLFTCTINPVTNLQTSLTANLRYCATAGASLVEDCRGADGTAGNGDDCGCAIDFQGTTGTCEVSGICAYPTYGGGLVANITESGTSGSSSGGGGTYVKFRTESLSYQADPDISYGTSCTTADLVGYGTTDGESVISSGTCDSTLDTVYFSIPCDASYGCWIGMRNGYLTVCGTETNLPSGRKHNYLYYTTGYFGSGVSLSSTLGVAPGMEVAC